MPNFMNFNLENYKDTRGSRVDPGRYVVRVEYADSGKAKSNNEMVTLGLTVMGGEFDGQTIVDRLVNSQGSLFRVVNFMQALGLATPKRRVSLDLDKLVGRTVEVDVEDDEPYMGNVKSRVQSYYKLNRKKSAAADDLEGLSEFSAEATDLPEEEGEAEEPPARAPQRAQDSSDDEVMEEVDLDSLNL